ncbi:hypothetical protein MAHJHV55_52660 [Mycobacterium avium subsp. hominissuis]
MSTVHETIAARAAGAEVLGVSLVTNLAARAAMVSCTVDMPTRSAPSVRSIRISAGVS